MSDEKAKAPQALTEQERVDACKREIARVCEQYRCAVVAYRTEDAVGDGAAKYLTTLHVGVRPLPSVEDN